MHLQLTTKKYLYLLILILISTYAKTQDRFEHFETTHGLSNNSVRYISQDDFGYLWFSTMNGVNLFNGKKFKHYVNKPEDSTSIYSNRILQTYTDQLGNNWFIGYDRHVNYFNRDKNVFSHTDFSIRRVKNTQSQQFILETSPGILWFNDAQGGIRKLKDIHNNKIVTEFTNFNNQLSTNDVNIITQDAYGKIWVGTQSGLFMIPSDTIPLDSKRIKQFWKNKNVSVTAITESNNEIWIGTKHHGIFIIDKANEIISTHPENEILKRKNILNISVNKFGDWLIATQNDGMYYFSEYKLVHHYTNQEIGWNSTNYFDTYVDYLNNFWIQSRKSGVTLINQTILKHFPLKKELRASVEEDESLFFLEDHNNDLWIGTYGSGLFKYDRSNNIFKHFAHEENNPSSISSNFILSLFQDNSHNLWIGTRNGGVNKLLLEKSNFKNYIPSPNTEIKLNSEVRAIAEDENHRIWIGTKTGEIQCLDPSFNLIAKLNKNWLKNNDFDLAGIYHLFFDSKGNLWVSTKGNGLYIFPEISGKQDDQLFKNLKIKHFHTKSIPAISSNYVYSVSEDQYGQFWVATYLGGVNRFNYANNNLKIDHFRNTSKTPNKLTDNRARCLLTDSDGNLWIGTGNGLNLIKRNQLQEESPSIIKITSESNNSNSISYNDILYIHEDNSQQIWIGTFGGGLNKLKIFNKTTNSLEWEHIDIDRQINDNTIYSVVSDKENQIWMATDQGICKLYPKSKQIDNFFLSDVIGRNSFSEAGCLFTHDSQIIFGHTNGLVSFSPDSIQKDTQQFPLVINSFYLYNELVKPGANSPLPQAIENTSKIVLDYDQNFIGFEFAALDYRSPNKISYFYKLENYEDSWNESGNENSAYYKNLKPGKYNFKVQSTNISGLPNDTIKSIQIVIKKPYYATVLAYIIYFSIAFGIVLIIMYFASKELQMKAKVELERQMTQNKLQFYTNISHELKTPLTLQLGAIDKVIKKTSSNNSNLIDLLQVKRNAHRLLNLIEQLIDFRKIQQKAYQLNYKNVNLLLFFEEIHEAFKPLAKHKKIQFQFMHQHLDSQEGIDQDSIERVIFNLLSNAFKNTKPGKKVILKVEKIKKHLEIEVIDEGIGIPKENLNEIFNQFTSGNQNNLMGESNSGIGLAFTKEIIKLMKGKIEVESEEDKGTKFAISIPLMDSSQENTNPHLKRRSQFELIHSELVKNINIEKTTKPRTEKGRILIVDDHDEVRQMLKDQVSSFYITKEATNGQEALEIIRTDNVFDLIISDLVMPRIDGIELTKKVRSNPLTAHIPVILLTALTGEENNLESIKAGADDFIAKPYHPEILLNKIESLIKQRKTLKQLYNTNPNPEQNAQIKTESKKQFLEKIAAEIENNIGQQNFNIDVLSAELGIGRSVFYKKMKEHTGKTPNEFIKNIKMKKAAELLRTTDKNISQIAYEVGYNDIGYFRRCFKNQFGEAPQVYQQKFKDY